MHLFNLNPRFRGLKFPNAIKPLTLKQKYQHIIPSDLLDFLESTLRLEARKRLTIDQCSNHTAFKNLRGETFDKENRNDESDSETEGSWKEIQFEEPCDDSREENFMSSEPEVVGKTTKNEINNGKSKQIDEKCDIVQKPAHIVKSTVQVRRENSLENVASNGLLNESIRKQQPNHQMQDAKTVNKEYSFSKGSENRNAKTSNHKKASTDIKLEIGALTKQYYGKYQKVNLNNNGPSIGKISANDMIWSTQQSSYLNAGQKGIQSKGPYGHLQSQSQVILYCIC